jgi:MoxR-like ATPase
MIEKTDFEKIMQQCVSLKPKDLIISDLKWRYLIRAVLRAKNIMIVGPSGCAKTMAARCVANVLNRPFEKFNIGSFKFNGMYLPLMSEK